MWTKVELKRDVGLQVSKSTGTVTLLTEQLASRREPIMGWGVEVVIVETAAGEIELEGDTTSMIGKEWISDGVVVVEDKRDGEEVRVDESREEVVVVGVV